METILVNAVVAEKSHCPSRATEGAPLSSPPDVNPDGDPAPLTPVNGGDNKLAICAATLLNPIAAVSRKAKEKLRLYKLVREPLTAPPPNSDQFRWSTLPPTKSLALNSPIPGARAMARRPNKSLIVDDDSESESDHQDLNEICDQQDQLRHSIMLSTSISTDGGSLSSATTDISSASSLLSATSLETVPTTATATTTTTTESTGQSSDTETPVLSVPVPSRIIDLTDKPRPKARPIMPEMESLANYVALVQGRLLPNSKITVHFVSTSSSSSSTVYQHYAPGRIYYVNHETKSTNWLPPRDVWPHLCTLTTASEPLDSPAPSTSGDSLGGASSSLCSNSSTSYEAAATTGHHQYRPAALLPYGWEVAIDSEGRQYFINHQNHCTTYRKPVDRSAAAAAAAAEPPRVVHLTRHPELGFGFVAGSERPVIVRFVKEGGPSEFVLQAGDQILEVNGANVRDAPRERVIELIRSGGRETVALLVCQPYSQNRKSALLTAAKKALLRSNPSRVRFADGVVINGSPLFPPVPVEEVEEAEVEVEVEMSAANQCCIGRTADDRDDPDAGTGTGIGFSLGQPFAAIPNVLKVFLENGQTKTFRYDGNTTVQTVVDSLCEKLAIKCKSHFGLVCQVIRTPKHPKRNGHAGPASTSKRSTSTNIICTDNNGCQDEAPTSTDDDDDNGGVGTGCPDADADVPAAQQQSSIKIHHQNQRPRPLPHRLLLLDPGEMLTAVACRPNAHNLRCLFRVVVPPRDPAQLQRRDPNAFDYLYHQCCNDVCQERFRPEIKYDQAIRLSGLRIVEHICSQHPNQKRPSYEWLESSSSGSSPVATPTRANLKQLDRDHGLREFVPGTLYDSMKRKELFRLLAHSIKLNRNLFVQNETTTVDWLDGSAAKQRSASQSSDVSLQAKMHFMKILSDLPCYGSKIFNTGAPFATAAASGDQHPAIPAPLLNQTLIVNPKNGLQYGTAAPTPNGATVAKIEDIRSVTVLQSHDHADDLEIHAHSASTADAGTTIRLSMDSTETEEFLLYIRSYHILLTDGATSSPVTELSLGELIDRSPVTVHRHRQPDWWTDGAPRYYSEHQVEATGWNYPRRDSSHQWHRVDLSVPPPSYYLPHHHQPGMLMTPTETVQSLDSRDSQLYHATMSALEETSGGTRPESVDMPSVISMEILESHAPPPPPLPRNQVPAEQPPPPPSPPRPQPEEIATPTEVMHRVAEMTRILNDTDRYLNQVVRPNNAAEFEPATIASDHHPHRLVIEVDINHNHQYHSLMENKEQLLLRQAETDLMSAMRMLDACEEAEAAAAASTTAAPPSPPQASNPYDPPGLERFIDESTPSPNQLPPEAEDRRVVAELDLLCDKLHQMKSNLDKVGGGVREVFAPPTPPPIIITTTDDDDDDDDDEDDEAEAEPEAEQADAKLPLQKRESLIANLVIPPPPASHSSTAQQVQEQMDAIRKFWKATDDVQRICREPRLTPSSNSSDSESDTFALQPRRQFSSLPTLSAGSSSVASHRAMPVNDERAYLESLKAKIARNLSLMMKNGSAPSSPPPAASVAPADPVTPMVRSQSLNQIQGTYNNVHPTLLLMMMMNQQQKQQSQVPHQVVSPKPPLPPGKRLPRKTSPLGSIAVTGGTGSSPDGNCPGTLTPTLLSSSSTNSANVWYPFQNSLQQQIPLAPQLTTSSSASSSPSAGMAAILNGTPFSPQSQHQQQQFWADFYGGDSTSSPGSSSSTTNMDLTIPPPSTSAMSIPYSISESKRSCFQTKEMEEIFAQSQYDIDTLLARLEEVHEKRLSSPTAPWYHQHHRTTGLGSLTAKESLIVESRHFVTASKLFVKCATEGSFQLIDYLTECVGLLERMFTVSEDVIMAEVESQAQITCLVDRLKEVAATYAYTVDTVRRLVRHPGCPRQAPNPYVDLLMNHATSLATSLSTLMRTLRSLASSSS